MNLEMLAGFFSSWIVYALILALHLALPGRWVNGYLKHEKSGKPFRYRLNGLFVLFSVLVLYWLAGNRGLVSYDFLWIHRWESLAGAVTLGLIFSFSIVLGSPSTGKSFLADFYLGRRPNPQLGGGRLDAKMFLYLVGAVLLELNLLSFAAHHFQTHAGDPSPGVLLYVGLFTFFICEYLFFEEVHLYTYDFFAERVGFKLGWGCLAFYPYFYAVGLWGTANLPNPHSHPALLVISAVVFFSGWVFARGANMQKYFFKKNPSTKFLGFLKPETIGSGKKKLLVNGFWGLSRHVNYLGEILMASGLALALGWPASLWPWLYPLYYVALLFPRQADDNKRCQEKYGTLWKEYRKRVKWKIIPGIY